MTLYRHITPDTSAVPLAPRIRTAEEVTDHSIRRALRQWTVHKKRADVLYRYYVGDTDGYMTQTQEDPTSTVTNFCGYIVRVLKGYLVGNAPSYTCAEDDAPAEEILDLYRQQRKGILDADIVQDLCIYGRAYELVYRGRDGKTKSVLVSPRDALVAYAGDMEEDSVFGAIRYEEHDADTDKVHYRLLVYTRDTIQEWRAESEDGPWSKRSEEPHGFGRVPLIEYRANKEGMGAFESIIALQNLYNRTLVNRVADKDAFVKSILAIVGQVIGRTTEEISDGVDRIRTNRVLHLDEGANAFYLEKSLDESGVQVLQDQIKSDIHKIAMVPDLSDEQFAANASGVAMAYKLFGTDQMVTEVCQGVRLGFARRCKLYDAMMHGLSGTASADVSQMDIVFRPNVPQDLSYMATPLTALVQSGIVSADTARRTLSIVDDPDGEDERVRADRDEQMKRTASAYMDDLGQLTGDDGPE